MQLHAFGVGRAHLGDLLATAHDLVVLDQQHLIVCVGGEEQLTVLDDHQVAVAAQRRPSIDHTPVACGDDRITGLAGDRQPLVAAFVEAGDHRACGRPHPDEILATLACRGSAVGCGWGRRCWHRRRCHGHGHGCGGAGRRRCRRSCGARLQRSRVHTTGIRHRSRGDLFRGWRHHAQHLSDLEHIRIFEIVPAHQIAPVLAVLQGHAQQRVARFDGVVARLAGVLGTRQRHGHGHRYGLWRGGRCGSRDGRLGRHAALFDRRLASRRSAPRQNHDERSRQQPDVPAFRLQMHACASSLFDAGF